MRTKYSLGRLNHRDLRASKGDIIDKLLWIVLIGYSRLPSVKNWLYHVHPLGQPYYECARSNSRFRFLTEVDLTQPLILDEIVTFVLTLEQKAISFPEISIEVEVVLDISDDAWSYYMVDVQNRRVFWMDRNEVTLSESGIERVEHLSTYNFVVGAIL